VGPGWYHYTWCDRFCFPNSVGEDFLVRIVSGTMIRDTAARKNTLLATFGSEPPDGELITRVRRGERRIREAHATL
jgi:hypothetical protein